MSWKVDMLVVPNYEWKDHQSIKGSASGDHEYLHQNLITNHPIVVETFFSKNTKVNRMVLNEKSEDASSGNHDCLYQIVRPSIQEILRSKFERFIL